MTRFLAGFGLLLILTLSIAAGGSKGPVYPLAIEVAGASGGEVQFVPTSGWTISIALKANQEPLGIARRAWPPKLPVAFTPDCEHLAGDPTLGSGFMVFSDPDESLSIINPLCNTPFGDGCLDAYWYRGPALDETFLEFSPGSNLPPNLNLATTGPSARLPGLVVLSDTGIGNVYNARGSLIRGRAVNLASNVNAVGYILRDGAGIPTVTATVAAPHGLINAKVEVDLNVGTAETCSAENPNTQHFQYRINGGPIQNGRFSGLAYDYSFMDPIRSDLESLTSTLRIFVVKAMNNGPFENVQPPLLILDKDKDGIVTAKDAVLMGYSLIAAEKTVPFKVYYDVFIPFEFADLDGNGCKGLIVAPAGAGGIVRVPE